MLEEYVHHNTSQDRKGPDVINSQRKSLLDLPCLTKVLESLPYIAFIINRERQVLIANPNFRELLSIESDESILGKRPGEIVNCIHSMKKPGGCGTSDECQFCGAVKAVLESQSGNERIEREARLITDQNGREVHFDLMVTSSPLRLKEETYYIVTMIDITSQKRRRMMERVFFHDVMNTAHGLIGTLEFLEGLESPVQMKSMIKTSQMITDNLVEEISFQRDLIAAESGDLRLHLDQYISTDIIEEVMRSISRTRPAKGKSMLIESDSERFMFETDERIIRRILINMTKNALEASEKGSLVKISSRMDGERMIFTVWNEGMIPKEVQAQIWQRTYSTKGEGRGIGTYSMKIFAEQYLNGSIEFTSTEEGGTTFSLILPISEN
jgi:K+-sensing histidine kinase KdpD